jgi:hypothetical protein
MDHVRRSRFVGSVMFLSMLVVAYAQSPTSLSTPPGGPPGEARPGSGRQGRGNTPIPGATEPPQRLFREGWTRAPLSQPLTQTNLANQHLTLHIYGDPNQIRKAMHPLDDYTYTGETTTNWALMVSDKAALWDVSGGGKIRFKTQNTGYRFLHVVIKTADGKYFASEEGAGESSVWIETDFIFQDLHWRNLLMTDTPTNASNRRQPDPKRVPIIPTSRGTPDLKQLEEVGFSDLMEGGWIPATSRVAAFELYGKAVPRK